MPTLDINIIPTYNLTTIAIGDNSVYERGFTIDSPTLEITVPGFELVTTVFSANSLNIYNSESLGLTKAGDPFCDLSDGIWDFTYSVYPNYKNKVVVSYFKTDMIEEKYYNTFLYIDITSCDNDIEKENKKLLDNIWVYITGAKAAARKCNRKLAIDLYTLADQKLDRFIKNNSCGL